MKSKRSGLRIVAIGLVLAQAALVFCQTSDESRLIDAAFNGDFAVVKRLCGHGVNVNCKDSQGATPLYSASVAGETKIVRYLLSSGADPAGADPSVQPLDGAAGHGNAETMRLLLTAGAGVDARGQLQRTALWDAAANGNEGGVGVLLHAGANPNLQDANGDTPLIMATRYTSIVRQLLKYRAIAKLANKSGETALHSAAEFGNRDSARLLLAAGAELEAKNAKGLTPLVVAIAARKNMAEGAAYFKANSYWKAQLRSADFMVRFLQNWRHTHERRSANRRPARSRR